MYKPKQEWWAAVLRGEKPPKTRKKTTKTRGIALVGGAGSGKDTYVRYFRDQFEKLDVRMAALADPIKRAAIDAYGFAPRQVNSRMKDSEWGQNNPMRWAEFSGCKTPREVLQRIGSLMTTEYILSQLLERLYTFSSERADVVLVSDVRRPQELIFLYELGFQIVFRPTRTHPDKLWEESENKIKALLQWMPHVVIPHVFPVSDLSKTVSIHMGFMRLVPKIEVEAPRMPPYGPPKWRGRPSWETLVPPNAIDSSFRIESSGKIIFLDEKEKQ